MIAIVNVSKLANGPGICNYELRSNRKLIAKFKHKRSDGLEICLIKAAKAAKLAEYNLLQELLK